jgi:hypothetical protein
MAAAYNMHSRKKRGAKAPLLGFRAPWGLLRGRNHLIFIPALTPCASFALGLPLGAFASECPFQPANNPPDCLLPAAPPETSKKWRQTLFDREKEALSRLFCVYWFS